MRKSVILSPLFSPSMQSVLAATVLQRDREWYLSDLAAHLHASPSSLQKPLAKLSLAGILSRRINGNRVYYRPDPACPILDELTSILVKTIGVAEPLRDALTPFAKKISVAFVHGSVAEERERSDSDVDVIVVGAVSGPDLAFALRPVQDRLGREVNVTRYTTNEFCAKVADRHHFLASVLLKRRIFLVGDEHELDKVTGRKTGGARAHKQDGT